MRVLHYSLGLPPFRSGGMTKYSFDLMKAQINCGIKVSLLYPGHYTLSKKTKISENKNRDGINIYEIINPLPVPLLGGIKNPDIFQLKIDKKIYINFLKKNKPDIIHVHTLMGIHKEFIEAARDLNIKTLFTTHDYFGICPKVNLVDFKGEFCTNFDDFNKCIYCNKSGFGFNKIKIMQSLSYRKIKEYGIVEKLKKMKNPWGKTKNLVHGEYIESNDENELNKKYSELNRYYIDMLKLVDYIHFNSSITKQVYNEYGILKGEIINISHSNIKDNRTIKKFTDKSNPLKITYMGNLLEYKGFFKLKDCLDKLLDRGINNWELNVYGNSYTPKDYSSNYKFHGKYSYNDLASIFKNTDVVVIPSICKETFGFIGLEALSYGIPTIISENVGFKDIIIDYKTGIIFENSSEELIKIIKKIVYDRNILKKINENIYNLDFKYMMENHLDKISRMYLKLLKERI